MSGLSSGDILAFLEAPEFIHAWKKVNEQSLLWSDFKKLPTPPNVSSEQLWEIITFLRYQAGVVLPFKPYVSHSSGVVWFSVPQEMEVQLQQLNRSSHERSALWQYIATNNNLYLHLFLYLNEVISVVHRDGVQIEDERIKAIWTDSANAATPNEKLLIKLREMLLDTERYLHRKITRGLIEEVLERLVGNEHFDTKPQKRLSVKHQTSIFDPEYALSAICTLSDKPVSEGLIHPIFSSLNISGIFWDHHPLPALNAMVDLVIKKIFYTQCDYPLLAYLPFSYICERWEKQIIAPQSKINFVEVLENNCKFGYDSTAFHAAILNLYTSEFESLASKIALFQQKEEHYRDKIDLLHKYNHRQKQILSTALLSPNAEISISTYQRLNKVSYATARQDLLQLAKDRFFTLKISDKAFLFSAAPNCLSVIDQMASEGDNSVSTLPVPSDAVRLP